MCFLTGVTAYSGDISRQVAPNTKHLFGIRTWLLCANTLITSALRCVVNATGLDGRRIAVQIRTRKGLRSQVLEFLSEFGWVSGTVSATTSSVRRRVGQRVVVSTAGQQVFCPLSHNRSTEVVGNVWPEIGS